MNIRKDIVWRFTIVYIAILAFSLLIIGKVFYIQTVEKEKWSKKAKTLTQEDITVEANRGDISSHDGRLLASSLPFYEIRMDMKSEAFTDKIFKKNVDSLAFCLSELFPDKSKGMFLSELINARKKGNRAFLVRRDATFIELKKLKQFPILKLGRYRGGFLYFTTNKRKHPYGELAQRTIGRLKNKGEPRTKVGIEGAFDHELRGKNGIRLMHRVVDFPDNIMEIEPEDGKDIITTINVDFQEVAHNVLRKQLIKHDAEKGTVVLMEVHTGAVRAISNLEKSKDHPGLYEETYNHAVGESTEPGSTFKLASLIVALEDGVVDLDDIVSTGNGVKRYYNFPITDSKRGGWGRISVQKAFEVSSNVGISKIIFDNYTKNPKKFIDRLYNMHLNEKLNLDIRGEGTPFIKYPGDDKWSKISLPQMSIGYEVRLTPLQTLTFYNAIANNGKMVRPRFVDEIRFHGKTVKKFHTEVIDNAICSQATLKKVQKVLKGVVLRGTAQNIRNNKYGIAGKTGTAKIYDEDKNRYISQYMASFVGYFPADNPRYSCIVFISKPQNGYYGNKVAAPVFKEIADKVFIHDHAIHTALNDIKKRNKAIPYSKSGNKSDLDVVCKKLNVPIKHTSTSLSSWVVTSCGENAILYGNRIIRTDQVPNVKGMGAMDALFILENAGLSVEIRGRGAVRKQSLAAGTKFQPKAKIILELG